MTKISPLAEQHNDWQKPVIKIFRNQGGREGNETPDFYFEGVYLGKGRKRTNELASYN